MELSESVQRGLQSLADPSAFAHTSYQVLFDVSFRSLLSSHADPGVLDQPELKQIDQILLKQSHAAATTFILEAVKQNADKSTISSSLEELTFSAERIEIFYSTYQKHKKELEHLLARIWWGSSKTLPRVWRKPVRCDVPVSCFLAFSAPQSTELQQIPAALLVS
ncbi:COMM domain-containing protein 3 isoform X2 [Morone saxatilis]|uniref:COMM domain-containing protein 3 isoform X2 n=1 Tax=Morone saxatilis TaxID=34816 RepID=UPI0015E20C03|nr:COMM domain-containing protein 3 isoform X2 [Morone saxatilis]